MVQTDKDLNAGGRLVLTPIMISKNAHNTVELRI